MKIVITLSRKDLFNPCYSFDDINLSKFKIDHGLILNSNQILFVDDDGRQKILKSR
jgi:hypothetical protein